VECDEGESIAIILPHGILKLAGTHCKGGKLIRR